MTDKPELPKELYALWTGGRMSTVALIEVEESPPPAGIHTQHYVRADMVTALYDAAQDLTERYAAGMATGAAFKRLSEVLAEFKRNGGER